MLPSNYVPIAGLTFGQFDATIFDEIIRSLTINERSTLRNTMFLVSANTQNDYILHIISRTNYAPIITAAQPGSPALTYAGVPVEVSEELPDGMVELYGPL